MCMIEPTLRQLIDSMKEGDVIEGLGDGNVKVRRGEDGRI